LPEFPRPALEALRQPIESGRTTVARAMAHVTYPARFQLIAAMNPCRCGHLGDAARECGRAPRCGEDYQTRLSGPLLDRIDIVVDVQRPSGEALAAAPVSDSATVREAVLEARERQLIRLTGTRALCNAQMDAQLVRDTANLDGQARDVLAAAYAAGGLSARGHERVIKVARTVADLAASERVHAEHVRQALALRPDRSMPAVVA
jgi:magnesium chelatase family protein